MKKLIILLFMVLLTMPTSSFGLNAFGVQIENSTTVNGQALQLNGFGLRSKMFGKIYIGSLYLTQKTKSPKDVINVQGTKLLRLNFLHSRIPKDKFAEAINEGFVKNVGFFSKSAEAQRLRALFTRDFLKGDVLDLVFTPEGGLVVKHNGTELGVIESKQLQNALLKTFFGIYPMDEAMRAGMLGRT